METITISYPKTLNQLITDHIIFQNIIFARQQCGGLWNDSEGAVTIWK